MATRRNYIVSVEVSYDGGATWVVEGVLADAETKEEAQELVVTTIDMSCVRTPGMCHRHVLSVEMI